MIKEGTENLTFENFACTRLPTLSTEEMVASNMARLLTQSECIQSRGKNIRFNRIKAYNNYAIGFYFAGTKSYNIAYRCDSYNNSGMDSATKGNADGFGAHGTGAEFIECRAWDNSDDNYDCISSFGRNIFDKCWSFRINYNDGDVQDGNGFKVGGWGKSATAKSEYQKYSGENPPVHIVKNCLAGRNKAYGFYSNHQPGQAAVWYNNRAYNNKANFDMTEGSETWELDSSGKVVDICGTREVLYFNFGHKYNTKLKTDCNMYGTEGNLFSANIPDENNKFNSWNFRNITLDNNDFLSVDWKELAGERSEDGSLPEVNFMKLNPNGPNYALLKTIDEEMKDYELLDNGTIIKLYKHYFDSDSNENKLCSTKLANCERCKIINSDVSCIECFSGYVVKYDNNIECSDPSSLSGNNNFFTNDSGITYYSCSLYNDVSNCLECTQKNICDKCQNNYDLYNDNTLCALKSDIDEKIYYNNNGLLQLCSSIISGCKKCDNSAYCLECESESVLLYDNTCLKKDIIELNQNYYKDESNNKYYSCSSLENCIKCTSKDVCIYCKEGYIVNNNVCEEVKETDSSNGLSTGVIVGIIAGCLVFLLLVVGMIIFIFKKKISNRKNIDVFEVNEEQIKNEGPNEKENGFRTEKESVTIHTIKRSVSSKQLNE